ncbi:thioredoxin-related transmembrane protein 2 homolog [Octopus bimaculoides]|uniref:Thioredoxin domain-containing protein n=1 Tax=Octopus bimaculoides TaxID=37653 RepID=A0A0L8FSG6_OCTBM|nr:thioredoxin-related transmembrane protein 2 homolog [Octopus bimaculoides]|eukprot:XP_014787327.1 PREDICTED: thioredoxin-related transmembrane protein 2 homolog [Octopus bimaculoides]
MTGFIDTAKSFFVPHYIFNVLLCFTYFFLKTTRPMCTFLFYDCKLELKEWEWLTFLACIIVIKNRRQTNFLSYISTACMFGKALNFLLFLKQGPIYGLCFAIPCLLHLIFCPEPAYAGPENLTYFRGSHLPDEIERDKRITWVIAFYAAWSPACISFAPIFAEVSSEYTLPNLKFGKLDGSRYPDIAKKYNIDTSTWSKQLPSVILFQEGKEKSRLPILDAKNKVVKYNFQKENFIRDIGLNDAFHQCKKTCPKEKKPKENDPKNNTADKDLDSKKKD